MNTIPIIRLEIEGMKRTLCTALSAYSAQLDADVNAAVEAYCTPENIRLVVSGVVGRVLENTIREEVERFFRFSGEGRKVIAAAVKERILKTDILNGVEGE